MTSEGPASNRPSRGCASSMANWHRIGVYGMGWGPMLLDQAIFWAKDRTTHLFTQQDLLGLNLDDLKHNGYRELGCAE